MTRDDIQKVIDKGGWILHIGDPQNVFKPTGLTGAFSVYTRVPEIIAIDQLGIEHRFLPGGYNWREATPEEVEKYCK